ncbi:expressed hypothetical protein [Trichoplax adhaerens]|uniref:Calponin-homology (CH) domain-containing protein n=1 Tax=Trichoplax adhaerens TaxID=10228 RepID=B3RX65_TRIAD|nr:expressed hypothetical protein [Trichoplax adhaerens]EDV24817.1 expressed hypothetical protein [Trichoplax adhaerens]|eukprot:XP_002112707.1 expressed hypothetical protein [Trichoplax adhaerens]
MRDSMSENFKANNNNSYRKREKRALAWIEAVNGKKNFGWTTPGKLRDGVALCNLINNLQPGSISQVSTSKMAFKQRENIMSFLKVIYQYGVPKQEIFKPVDLLEGSNMLQVICTIEALGQLAHKKGYKGPALNDKILWIKLSFQYVKTTMMYDRWVREIWERPITKSLF